MSLKGLDLFFKKEMKIENIKKNPLIGRADARKNAPIRNDLFPNQCELYFLRFNVTFVYVFTNPRYLILIIIFFLSIYK